MIVTVIIMAMFTSTDAKMVIFLYFSFCYVHCYLKYEIQETMLHTTSGFSVFNYLKAANASMAKTWHVSVIYDIYTCLLNSSVAHKVTFTK